jgi:uncharacterized protein (TIGR03067 family)
MRKVLCGIVAVTVALAGGSVQGGDKETNESVLKKIQGTWNFIAQEMAGKPAPKEALAKMTVTFSGDKWTVRDGDKVLQGGTHKFNPDKKPGEVNAKITEGEGKGSTMLGIYEMKGNTIRVCFDPQGKARPTSFTPKEGQFAATVERQKKK